MKSFTFLFISAMLAAPGVGHAMPIFDSFTQPQQAPSRLDRPEAYFQNANTVAMLKAAMLGDAAQAHKWKMSGGDPNEEGPLTAKRRLRLLHYGLAARSDSAIKILLDLGANPELDAAQNSNAFIFAMYLNDPVPLGYLLDNRPISSISYDILKRMAKLSINMRFVKNLELLFERGLPVDFKDTVGYTLFLEAMAGADIELAEMLLKRGASMSVSTGAGVTPANSLEQCLKDTKPGSEMELKLMHLKNLMQERGAVFPAKTPAQIRAEKGVS